MIPSSFHWPFTLTVVQSRDGKTKSTDRILTPYFKAIGRIGMGGLQTFESTRTLIFIKPEFLAPPGAVFKDGYLSLSHTNTGEGTLRLLPHLKASVAYIMLRPFFHTGEFDDSLPTFPGATPGNTQLFPTTEHHPHLDLERAVVGIPPVRPGDYVFWHCDLVHGVDQMNQGKNDSSVFYNASNPLTPANVDSLLATRDAFLEGDVPVDFMRGHGTMEREYEHEDHGARKENILTDGGLRAMGLLKLDEDEEGLTSGQREVRRIANHMLGL